MQVHVDRYNLLSYIVCVGRNAQSGISDGNECMAGGRDNSDFVFGNCNAIIGPKVVPNWLFRLHIFYKEFH